MAKIHGIEVPEEYILQDQVMELLRKKKEGGEKSVMTNWAPYRKEMRKSVKAKMREGMSELAALKSLLNEK